MAWIIVDKTKKCSLSTYAVHCYVLNKYYTTLSAVMSNAVKNKSKMMYIPKPYRVCTETLHHWDVLRKVMILLCIETVYIVTLLVTTKKKKSYVTIMYK